MNNNYYDVIITEITNTLKKIPVQKTEELISNISTSKRIFITGKGRTGLLMQTFAIRLMQMGFKVHIPGESTTPSIQAKDMLLIGSGSGETESLIIAAKKAKKIGAMTVLISMSQKSSIARIVDLLIILPAKGSKYDESAETDSIQPMCNLFEQCLLIFLDSLGMSIMEKNRIDKKTLYERHANLE